jgi:predicted PurR-regulated permease PerM
MVSAGMIGLFVGAVLMALGYRIFMEWVYEEATADDEPAPATAD